MKDLPIQHAMRRRSFVAGTAAVAGGLAVPALAARPATADTADPAGSAAAADPVVLHGDGATLSADATGTVTVLDSSGTPRATLGGPWLNPQGGPTGGSARLVPMGAAQALAIDYDFGTPGLTLQSRFTFTGPGHVHVRHDILGGTPVDAGQVQSPTDIWLGGTMLYRHTLPNETATETYASAIVCTRDERGGIPYEQGIGSVFTLTWRDYSGSLVIPGSNAAWRDPWRISAPATQIADGHCAIDADVLVGVERRPVAAASVAAARPVGLEIWTDQAYNLWNAFDTPITVHAQALNGGAQAATVRLTWTARDFDGVVVARGTLARRVGATQTWNPDIVVDPTAGGHRPQRILFLEVVATIPESPAPSAQPAQSASSAFARTNLTAMRPYAFTDPSSTPADASMVGLAGFFLPGSGQASEAELAMARRVGARWLRSPKLPADRIDALGFSATYQPSNDGVDLTKPADSAWLRSLTDDVRGYGARDIELLNEVNFQGDGLLTGSSAKDYVDNWLRPVRQALDTAGRPATLSTMGIAGMDYVWVEKLVDAGGWELIDGLAVHPGRGNFTADYAPPKEQWKLGTHGEYWNFYGSLKEARRLIQAYGQKELWLTEVYALTHPNDWWNDTFRQAAENTLLEHLLAKQIGVAHTLWYQVHDGVWYDPTGVRISDREFSFGLLNHDTSLKPSMLAFETAARLLDGGTRFVRWLDLGDPDLRGMEFADARFSNPARGFVVLWSRKDGFVLNADHGEDSWYAFPEAWVDDWPTKTGVRLPTKVGSVTEIDCIGRERTIRSVRGTVGITLDGAPRVYLALDTAAIPTGKEPT